MAEQALTDRQKFELWVLILEQQHLDNTSLNIISTVNLGCKLDLEAIALRHNNAEYNPKRIDAVVMRIREPKNAALIYASGKVVCTGAKSDNESKLAARKYARIIQKLGFSVKFEDFKILNPTMPLPGLAHSHGAFSSVKEETSTAFENLSLSDVPEGTRK